LPCASAFINIISDILEIEMGVKSALEVAYKLLSCSSIGETLVSLVSLERKTAVLLLSPAFMAVLAYKLLYKETDGE
jgi:hypothetical protein